MSCGILTLDGHLSKHVIRRQMQNTVYGDSCFLTGTIGFLDANLLQGNAIRGSEWLDIPIVHRFLHCMHDSRVTVSCIKSDDSN